MPSMTVLEQEALKASTVTLSLPSQLPSQSSHHQLGYGLLRKVGVPDFAYHTPACHPMQGMTHA